MRGAALLLTLAMLSAIFAAALLLGNLVLSRVHSERTGQQREVALRQCEEFLERARAALETHALSLPGILNLDGTVVNCSATANGARLEVVLPLPGQLPAGARKVRRGLRVTWDLARSHSQNAGWQRTGWKSRNENFAP